MTKTCGVEGCLTNNRKLKFHGQRPKKFYRIPAVRDRIKDPKLNEAFTRRRSLWLQRLFGNASANPYSDLRICEDHFVTGQPGPPSEEDHPDWAPSLGLPYFASDISQQTQKDVPSSSVNMPEELTEDASVHNLPEDISAEESIVNLPEDEVGGENFSDAEEEIFYDACSEGSGCVHVGTQTVRYLKDRWTQVKPKEGQRSIGVQTELVMGDIDRTERHLTEALNKLNVLELGESAYKDEEVTRYYTALPNYAALMVIYKLVSPHIPYSPRNVLTKFQQLALTLMKLRLNLYFRDLGYRFGVSRNTAYRTFHRVMEVMYCRLQRFIFWPEREVMKSTMPQCFKEAFGDSVTVIIDCFEVYIEKAGNQMAQAQTWSNYKHHQTVKFLIGITPQGLVCFISDAFGGRSSDTYITEQSKFLEYLNPGDVVMADRGFLIEDSVHFRLAKVVMPAFTKGLQQLSPQDVEATRSIANVRIHVERVIGQLRQKYRILSNRLPITFLNADEKNEKVSINEIASVCCALVNCCDTIIPFE